ncbi:MAG TPA: helix-turn-helix transcriptional regulator, partial [Polyangiaceae bacterium]|nr:helix-turn-helix transcriptional regulator [Polyangiaceae bacterium]
LLPWLDNYAAALLPPESVCPERIPGLREQIRSCLQAQAITTLSHIARGMRLSPRTLQRRLRDARTSFRDELDEVRRELAESYLRDPNWSIKAIALRLGYADRNGFERAFRKWCRATPTAFRSALASPALSMQNT